MSMYQHVHDKSTLTREYIKKFNSLLHRLSYQKRIILHTFLLRVLNFQYVAITYIM